MELDKPASSPLSVDAKMELGSPPTSSPLSVDQDYEQRRVALLFDPGHPIAELIIKNLNIRDLSNLEQVSVICNNAVKEFGWPSVKDVQLRAVVRATGRGAHRRFNRIGYSLLGQALLEANAMRLLYLLCARLHRFSDLSIMFFPPSTRRANSEEFRRSLGRVLRHLAASIRRFGVSVGRLSVEGLGFDDRFATPNILLPFLGINTNMRELALCPAVSPDPGPRAFLPPDDPDTLRWDTLEDIILLQDFPSDFTAKMAILQRLCTLLLPPVFLSTVPIVSVTVGWLDPQLAFVLLSTLLKAPSQLAAMELEAGPDDPLQQRLAGLLLQNLKINLHLRAKSAYQVIPGTLISVLDAISPVDTLEGGVKTLLNFNPKVLLFKFGAVEITVSEL